MVSVSDFDRFVHEKEHLLSLEGFDFGALLKKWESEEKRPRSKSELVALLLKEGARWCQWGEGLPESLWSEQERMPGGALKSRFEMLVGTKEHELNHRVRLMGIDRLL